MKTHLLTGLVLGCALLLASASEAARVPNFRWRMAISIAPANGGLAGVRSADVTSEPEMVWNPDSMAFIPRVGFKRVHRNLSYRWKPAVSTGIIFRDSDHANTVCGGLGFHFVWYQDHDATHIAPSITFNFGKRDQQVFFGPLFAASDEVRLPDEHNDHDSVVLPLRADSSLFVRPRARSWKTFYAGVVFATATASK